MAKYQVNVLIKFRIKNPENRSGFSWLKYGHQELSADTIEELTAQAYAITLPESTGAQAINCEGTVYLSKGIKNRQYVTIKTFKEL